MDARTGVQRQQPSKSAWNAAGVPGRAAEPATAVVDGDGTGAEPAFAGRPGTRGSEDRISVDPLRATDRYRLVMPYVEGV